MRNIILIGFMGTGKTTVGKILAKQLNAKFVDTDELIEKQEHMPIPQIFSQKGEPYFREVEKKIIKQLSTQTSMVIAAGGGAVLNRENVANLRRNGAIICLSADSDVILKRVQQHQHRPLLNVSDRRKRIEELLELRLPYYQKAADYIIDTSELEAVEAAGKIFDIVKGII
ncbi:MAG: shikimate kinase [Candidatus Omnitrophota bacterium]